MTTTGGQVSMPRQVHDGFLDMMVNGNEWLGQLGELRAAILDGRMNDAAALAQRPIRFRPWRVVLGPVDQREGHDEQT